MPDTTTAPQLTDHELLAMRRLLAGPRRDEVVKQFGDRAEAGIFLWAVDSLEVIDGGQELIDRLAKMNPLERLGTPQDIASVVAFLVGADGGWINGQVLRPNGGMI